MYLECTLVGGRGKLTDCSACKKGLAWLPKAYTARFHKGNKAYEIFRRQKTMDLSKRGPRPECFLKGVPVNGNITRDKITTDGKHGIKILGSAWTPYIRHPKKQFAITN